MLSADSQSILNQFDNQYSTLNTFAEKLENLLRDLLNAHEVSVHSITSRVKTQNSLERKLARPGAIYQQLNEITDIVGLRIICHFSDDVDRVARIVESEFTIDKANTTDKRQLLDPDRFGYLSLHHIVSLSSQRVALTEYRKFPGLKAEIQTRSILQHAWAEIEHDLGYKASIEIPRHIRRRFSRVAGLLELADEEFIQIRNELSGYEKTLPETIQNEPEAVLLDKPSLTALIEQDTLVQSLDLKIAQDNNSRLTTEESDVGHTMRRLELAGIKTIGEIKSKLPQRQQIILGFAEAVIASHPSPDLGYFPTGISLFYLAYVFVAESRNDERIRQFIQDAKLSFTLEQFKRFYEDALKRS